MKKWYLRNACMASSMMIVIGLFAAVGNATAQAENSMGKLSYNVNALVLEQTPPEEMIRRFQDKDVKLTWDSKAAKAAKRFTQKDWQTIGNNLAHSKAKSIDARELPTEERVALVKNIFSAPVKESAVPHSMRIFVGSLTPQQQANLARAKAIESCTKQDAQLSSEGAWDYSC